MVFNEHLFSLAFESLLRCSLCLRVSYLRLLFLELTRVFNGLLCISCSLMDLGAMTPLLWSFEERDKLMTFFDYVCGCRMHLAFICLCGCLDDFTFGLLDFLFFIIVTNLFLLDLLDLMVCSNRFFYLRLRGLSLFSFWDICFNSLSGVLARSCGLLWDVRLFSCYELYSLFYFCFAISFSGDSMDRFILRLFDMRNSLLLCKQFLFWFLLFGFLSFLDFIFNFDFLIDVLIYVFYMCWCLFLLGVSLSCIEHPKGEYCLCICLFYFGFTRCRIRCADFLSVLLLDLLCRGFLLADLVAVIGNLDCVFGSVDR